MLALIVAALGVVGVWLLAGFLLFFVWTMDRHPLVFWAVLFSIFGGVAGLGIYDDFIVAG